MCHSINLITHQLLSQQRLHRRKGLRCERIVEANYPKCKHSRRRFLTRVNANTLLKPEKDILANESKTNDATVITSKVTCLFAIIKTLSRIALFILSSSRGVFRRGKFTEALVHADFIAFFVALQESNESKFESYIKNSYFKYLSNV